MPLAANASIWTPPYFDAGGGEIWMTTHSVPARDAGGIFAIVTTDLPVDAPASNASSIRARSPGARALLRDLPEDDCRDRPLCAGK